MLYPSNFVHIIVLALSFKEITVCDKGIFIVVKCCHYRYMTIIRPLLLFQYAKVVIMTPGDALARQN